MEYSGKVDFWGLPDDEFMSCENIVELVENYRQDMGLEEKAEEEITIYGYIKKEINKDRLADWVIDELSIMTVSTSFKAAPLTRQYCAIFRLPSSIVYSSSMCSTGYKVETLDKVCEKKIRISDYIEEEKSC